MMGQRLISEHYEVARVKIRIAVSRLEHDELDATDAEEWAKYICRNFFLKPIVVGDGTPDIIERKGSSVGIFLPIESSDDAIKVLQFTPGTWKNSTDVWVPMSGGIVLEANPNSPDRIRASVEAIKENIALLNARIAPSNRELEQTVRELVEARMVEVKAKRQVIVGLAEAIGGNLILSESERNIQQVAPKLREDIATLRRPQPRPGKVVRLGPENFQTILSIIDKHATSFERTPTTATKLGEEDLRNLLLAGLNGALNLDAKGEVFSKRGKTDIFLDLPEGSAFIAECKIWDGPSVIGEAVKQILGYLTWKDAYGVVILFSRNKNYSKVLNAAVQAISSLPSLWGNVTANGERHWISDHFLPGDENWTVNIQCLVYNIYKGD